MVHVLRVDENGDALVCMFDDCHMASYEKLTAVYKMRGETTNDGKMYVGTYAWSPKEQAAARNIVNLMFPAQK